MTGGGVTQVVYVNPLTDAQTNPDDDTVSGVFAELPNTPIFVAVDGVTKKVTTNGSGAFTVSFDNIDWTDVATIYTTNADGNQVYYERGAKEIRVRSNGSSYDGDNIYGYWPVDATLDFEVEHSGWVESDSVGVGAGSAFSVDFDPITDTATITVTDGVITDVINVAEVSGVTLDSYTEELGATLTGAANAPVTAVWQGEERETTTNGSGAFTANFEGDGDIAVGDTIDRNDPSHFYYADGDYEIYYSDMGRAYGVRVRMDQGNYDDDDVDGWFPEAFTTLTVTRKAPFTIDNPTTFGTDNFFSDVDFSGPDYITDTNTITATNGTLTRTVDTPRVTAIGDYVNDIVSGTGPAGARLRVYIPGDGEKNATVQADETWVVTTTEDLEDYDEGWVRYTESDGDEVYYYWHVAWTQIRLYDYGTDLEGYFPIPNHPISITLWNGTTYKDGTDYTTNSSGYYGLNFGPQVEEVDTIRVTDGTTTQTYDVPDTFNGVGDANTDMVSGRVSAATNIADTTGNVYPNLYVDWWGWTGDYVTTDNNGDFAAFSWLDLTRGDDGYVRYIDAEGTEFYRNITVPGISWSEVDNTGIQGYFPQSGVLVTATLYSVTDTFKSTFTYTVQGWNNWFGSNFAQTVQMGDLIEVTDGTDVLSLRVPTVTVHSNQVTDLVNGTIETAAGGVAVSNTDNGKYPLLDVGTNTASGWEDDYVTSDAAGVFTYDPHADIQGGDSGRVEYTDAEGDYVRYPDFYAAGIRVMEDNNYIAGEGFQPNAIITATLSSSPGVSDTTTTDNNGYVSWFPNFGGDIFDPGDTITVTDGTNMYVVTVPDLQIRAYAGSDKVFGTGLGSNAKLEVILSSDVTYREVTDLGGGNWELDLSADYDFDIEEDVHYHYTEDDGDQVYHTGSNYPVGETDTAQVRWTGSVWDAGLLRGYFPGWTAGNITATLHAADGTWRVDGSYAATSAYYEIDFGLAIQDGDFITVTDGTDVIRIDVPTTTVDYLDYVWDYITGTIAYTDGVNPVQTQASDTVTDLLRAINTDYSSHWYYSAFFNADANGYDLDMSTTPRGIHPNDDIRYLYVDAAGNEVYFDTQNLDTTAAMTTSGEIRWNGNTVWGYEEDRIRGYWTQAGVNVTVSYSTTNNTYSDVTDGNGWFDISTPGWNYFPIQDGEVITLTGGTDTVVIPIADVQVGVDADADTLTVSGLPANKDAQVQLYSSDQWTVTNVTANGAGQAMVDFGALNTDIEAGDEGYVVYDPHGFAVYTQFYVYGPPQVYVYEYTSWVDAELQNVCDTQPYTITLRTGAQIKDEQTGNGWFCWSDSLFFSESIEPGDTVDVTVLYPDGVERSTSVYVDPAFAVEDVDFVADTVTFTAPAGITGTTWVELPHLWVDFVASQFVTGTTGTATTYVADDVGDLGRDANDGWVWYGNAEGNYVGIEVNNPVYQIWQHSDDDDVTGRTMLVHADILATLYDDAGQVRAQVREESDDDGDFQIDFEDVYGYDLQVKAGDTVELDVEGEGVTTIVLPTLTGMADFAQDTVSGVIAGAGVTFPITGSVEDDAPSLLVDTTHYVTPTAGSGVYVAENLGLVAGDDGELRYVRNDGHEIYNEWRAPQLQVRYDGDYNANNVEGYIPTSQNVTVTLRLLDSDGTTVRDVEYFQTDEDFSREFEDVYGNDVDIENGDSVEMLIEGHTWSVNVPDPFYVEADYVDDTVSGQVGGAANFIDTADITESLFIEGFGIDAAVATDANGNFSAAGSDFGPLDTGIARYRDAQGFEVYQQAIAPWAMIELGGNRVDGSVVRPNVPVAVTLYDSADTFRDDEQATSEDDGQFAVEFEDNLQNPVIIEGGDWVEIVASPPITVDVPTIEVWANADTDVVSGTISVPVDQNQQSVVPNLYIKIDFPPDSGLYRWVTTTASSPYTFEYDFSGVYDIQNDDTGEVRYTNADGHQIYINFTAQSTLPHNDQIELYLRSNDDPTDVRGIVAYANVSVTLRLEDSSGTVKGTNSLTAGGGGQFGPTSFEDAAGNAVEIADGDVAYVISEGETMSVTVPTMTDLLADPETDAVSGTLTGAIVDQPLSLTVHEMTHTTYVSSIGTFNWTDVTATTGITLSGFTSSDDGYTDTVPLGFDFEFYDQVYTQAIIGTNGLGGFGTTAGFGNANGVAIPNLGTPNNFFAPFWDDLDLSGSGHIYYTTMGTAPNRVFIVQWDQVPFFGSAYTTTFQVLLYEGSDVIKFQYADMNGPDGTGVDATIGLENNTGLTGTLYAHDTTGVVTDSLAIVFTPNVIIEHYWQEVSDVDDQLHVVVDTKGTEYVTTTLAGAFNTLNGPSYGDPPDDVEAQGVAPSDTGHVEFINVVPNAGDTDWVQRHHVYYDFTVPAAANTPFVLVRQGDPTEVWGRVAWPTETIVLSLYDAAGVLKSRIDTTSDASGDFDEDFADAVGDDVPIEDGDVVEVVSLDTHVVITVPVHTIEYDVDNDLITGTLTGPLATHPISTSYAVTRAFLEMVLDSTEWLTTSAAGVFHTDNQSITQGDTGYLRFYSPVISPSGDLAAQRYIFYDLTVSDLVFEALRVRGHTAYAVAEANYGGRDVTFYLYDETGTLIDEQADNGAWWGDGDYDVDFPNHTIQPGYTVKVVADDDPTLSRTFTVPAMAVTDVNPLSEAVAGTAAFAEAFEVNWGANGMDWDAGALDNPGGTTRIITPTAGTWAVDFLGDEDIRAGDSDGYLLYTDADGNQLYQRYAAQQVTVYKDQARVQGPIYNGGVTVTLTLLDSAGNVKDTEEFAADAAGDFDEEFRDIYDNLVYAHAGDRVVVEASYPVTIEVPVLSAWADWYDETVHGGSDRVDETINVNVAGCSLSVDTQAASIVVGDITATYNANFVGLCDLAAGNNGWVYYTNDDGNRVRLDFTVPELHVRYAYDTNRLAGYTAAGTEVTVTAQLADASGEVKGITMTTWGVNSHGWYEFDLYDEYGNPTPILPGDIITVTETAGIGVREQTFTVPQMTANTDLLADVVSGQMGDQANTAFEINAAGNTDTFTTTTGGAYSANFAPVDDLVPGDSIQLTYADTDYGRWFYFENYAPVVFVRTQDGTDYSEAWVAGYTDSEAQVAVTLWRNGALLASAMDTQVNWDGSYALELMDNAANSVAIEDGDVVQVQTENGTTRVTVADLDFTPDVAAQTVTGSGMQSGSEMEIYFGGVERSALVTGSDFSVTFPAEPPTFDYGDYGYAHYLNNDQNLVHYEFFVPVTDAFVRVLEGPYTDHSGNKWNVGGYVPVENADVTVTLLEGTTVKSIAYADASNHQFGAMLKDSYGDPITIMGGDTVRLESEGMTALEVTVPAMAARGNPTTDIVSGTVGGLTIDQTGQITNSLVINLGEKLQSDAGRSARTYGDLDDTYTYSGGYLFKHIYFYGYSSDNDTLDATVRAYNTTTGVWDTLYNGGGGSRVLVTQTYGTPIYSHVRIALDDTENNDPIYYDYAFDLLVVGGRFEMNAGRDFPPGSTRAITATAGAFEARMLGLENQNLIVLYTDNDGNEFYTFGETDAPELPKAPVVRAWVGDYQVGGLAPLTDEAVTITLTTADGTVKSVETDTADATRAFQEVLFDGAGNHAYIEPGDTVTVEFGDTGESVTLAIEDPFTLDVNASDEVISGILGSLDIAANPVVTKGMVLNVGAGSVNFGAPRGTLPLDAGINHAVTATTGVYSTTWPSGLSPSDVVWAVYTNDAGHQQFRQTVVDAEATISAARVTLYANENYVYVEQPQRGNAPVTVTLTRDGVAIASTEGATGEGNKTWDDVYGSDEVYARAGDIVQVDFETDMGIKTYMVTVPELSALANYQTDTVSGVGPAGQKLEVDMYGADSTGIVSRTVIPDPEYQVNYTGIADIRAGDQGRLYYIITDTAQVKLDVYMDFRAPQVTAYKGQTYVWGYTAFSDGSETPVTVTLYRDGAIVGYTAFMASGWYGEDLCDVYGDCDNDYGNAAALRAGDELVISARGEPEIRVTIPELAAWADENADVVTGESNLPDTDIEVEMNGTEQTVRTEADGTFTADFSAPPFLEDFDRGDTGYVYYLTPDGHRVYLEVRPPHIEAYLGTNYVYAQVATDIGSVTGTLTLKDSVGAIKAQTSFASSYNVSVRFYDAFGNPVFIAAGDTVELDIPNDDPIILAVPTLTAQANAATDEVAITAPVVHSTKRPSATLELRDFPGNEDRMLTSDTTAYTVWERDWDVVPGDSGTLVYTNENGDEVHFDFVTPIVRVHASSVDVEGHTASGYAQPGKMLAVALKRSGATLWSGAAETDPGDGDFGVSVPVAIEAGDIIQVQGGGLNASVDVVALDATIDYEEDTVTGNGPMDITHTGDPLHALWVTVDSDANLDFDAAGNRYTDGATKAVTTTAAGGFAADFSGEYDITDGAYAEVRYTDAEGHQVYAQFEAHEEAPEAQIYIWQGDYNADVIEGTAGERNAVVWVTLYAADGTTEKATCRTTADGAGWFEVDDRELQDVYGEPVQVEGGDYVEVRTWGWTSGLIEVVPLSARADVEAEAVSGTGPLNIAHLAGDTTFVVAMGGETEAVTTTATGDFKVVFADIDRGELGELAYATPDYVIQRQFAAPGYTEVNIGMNYLAGYVTDPGITVTVELVRAGTLVGDWEGHANSGGRFSAHLRDVAAAPVYVQIGDEVRLSTSAGESWAVTVPNLTIEADPESDVVTGAAPAGARVQIWDAPNSVWRDATAFGGTYTYDFTGRRDIRARSRLEARYHQDQSGEDFWYFYSYGSVPGLAIELYDNWMDVYVGKGRTGVSYAVRNARGATRLTDFDVTDGYGYFGPGNMLDIYDNEVNLHPGDQIMIDAGSTVTYTVPTLSALADPGADRITGRAPADMQVQLCIGGYCQTVWTDGSGGFTANFTGRTDIEAGDIGWLYYHDADGNAYELNFTSPYLEVEYQGDPTDGSYVDGNTSRPNITYTLELERGGGVIARMSDVSDDDGAFTHNTCNLSGNFCDLYGNPLLTEDGDVVILYEQGVEVNRTTVRALSALVDIFANTVTGSGPADSQIEVDAFDGDKTVTTDGSGNYTAANPFYSGSVEAFQDFNAGDTCTLRYYHSDGDQIYYRFIAPYLEVWAAFQPGVGSTNDYDAGYVDGSGWPAGRPVVLTLYDSAGNVKDTETVLGGRLGTAYFVDEYGNRVEILAGDRVVAQAQGVPALDVTVPALDVRVDLEADAISGTFGGTVAALPVHPAGSTTHTLDLAINYQNFGWPRYWDYEYRHDITTTAAGAFEYRFADEVPVEPIDPGRKGEVRYNDHNANTIHLPFEAPRELLHHPQVNVQLYERHIWGTILRERVPLTVTLTRGDAILDMWAGLAGASGDFDVHVSDDVYGHPLYIMPGDQIIITAEGLDPLTVAVPDLTVVPDAGADVVTGTAPEVGELEVTLAGTLEPEVQGGVWVADFRAHDADFAGSDAGTLIYTDAEGHNTYLNFRVPRVIAYLYDDRVNVYGVYPNMPITATMTHGAGNVKAQAQVEATVDYTHHDLEFRDRFNQPVLIEPGDTVTVYPYGATAHVLTMVELDASANPETDQVTGVGPAGELLEVDMGSERSMVPVAGGTFMADFTGLDDIRAGDIGQLLYYLSAQGDVEVLSFAAPVVRVRAGEGSNAGLVHGYADRAGRDVRVEVVRDGNVVATYLDTAAPLFSVTVEDIYENVVPIQPGDTVNVSFDGGTPIPVVVPSTALGAELDVVEDTVTLSGPVSATVEFSFGGFGGSNNARTVVLSGGTATLDYAGYYDIQGNTSGYIHWRDANGNSVYVNTTAPSITVYEYQTRIEGYVAATGGLARARLVRGGEEVAKGSGYVGTRGYFGTIYFTDKFGQRMLILPGDTVEVTAPDGTVTTIAVEELWAEVDVANDAITILGPAGEEIEINFAGAFYANTDAGLYDYRTVEATGSDQVVEYTDSINPNHDIIRSGAYGWLNYYTDVGHRVRRYFRAPRVWVYQGQNRVDGDAQHNGADVLVELVRGGSVIASVRTEADASGNDYRVDFMADGEPVIIEQGDVIRVTENGGAARERVIEVEAALSASMDAASDMVTGDAPGPVEVEVGGVEMTAWPESGTYTADFTGRVDIQGSAQGQLDYQNADGHTVYLNFAMPYVEVEEGSNYVHGYVDRGEDVEVDVELWRAGSRVAAERVMADGYGAFSTHLVHADGTRALIRPGDTVRVTAQGETREVAVAALTADVDEVANAVTGTAPDGEVWLGGLAGTDAMIASSGTYSLTYGDADIGRGAGGQVRYIESDGDRVYREFSAPYIAAEVGGNTVYGMVAYKYVTVTVQIQRGGSVIAEDEAFIENRSFSFDLFDAQGLPLHFQDGDLVSVSASDAVVAGDGAFSNSTLTIRTLNATVNAETDTVSGVAPDGLLWIEVSGADQDVVASGGSYSADFGGVYDIVPGQSVWVAYYDAEHDLGYINAYVPQVIVWEGTATVEGYVPCNNDIIQVTVSQGGTPLGQARVAPSHWFNVSVARVDDENTHYLIQPDDVAAVTCGDWSASIPVVPLSAAVDTVNDEVDVTGPADSWVDVTINNSHKPLALSGGSGTAMNPFFGSGSRSISELDLQPGTAGYVRYLHDSGHEVRRTFAAPQVNARLSNNEIWGYVNGGVQEVTVILSDASGEKARAYDWTNNNGYFSMQMLDVTGQDVIIHAADTVAVQVGGSPVHTMTVAALTVAANAETDEIAGTAPAGSVYVHGTEVEVAADNTYRYYRSLSVGSHGEIYYPDAEGDRTYLQYAVAGLTIREMGYAVWGYVPVPNAVTKLRLHSSTGALVDVDTVRSSSNAYVSTEFSATIQPGSVVDVLIAGQPTVTIPIPELTAMPLAATDRVTGTGPADSELHVYHRYRSAFQDSLSLPFVQLNDEMRQVRTDATGGYVANFAAESLRDDVIEGGEYGYVSYTNDEGHTIFRTYRTPLVRIDITNETVEIFAMPGQAWQGRRDKGGTFAGATDEDGHLIAQFIKTMPDGDTPADIRLGDTLLLVNPAGETVTMTVPSDLSLSIAHATDIVSGTAPTGTVHVRAFHWQDAQLPYRRGGWISQDKVVASNGTYSADFSGDLDLVEYDYAYAYYQLAPDQEIVFGAINRDKSPVIPEIRETLADESYVLDAVYVDTRNYNEIQTFYLTAEGSGPAFFGLGWNGSSSTKFRMTIEGPLEATEPKLYYLEGNDSPMYTSVPSATMGSTWKITVQGLSVPNDTFNYVAFIAFYKGREIYLPFVVKNFDPLLAHKIYLPMTMRVR